MAKGTFISRNKQLYSEEVAAIKPFEVFGVDSCGVTWEKLFRKHLAFDVLKCGGISCDNQSCLKNEVESSCKC